MITHEIETERLRLRLFALNDAENLYQILANPEVKEFLADGEDFSREDALAIIKRILVTYKERGFGRWAVIHKEDEKFIGYCGLIVLNEAIGVEIAYLFDREYWKRGLATEAARACLRYAFEQLRCERIAAISLVDNLASKRVIEHLRMTHVQDLNYFGRECFHYAIVRDEFRCDDSPYALREVELTDIEE